MVGLLSIGGLVDLKMTMIAGCVSASSERVRLTVTTMFREDFEDKL